MRCASGHYGVHDGIGSQRIGKCRLRKPAKVKGQDSSKIGSGSVKLDYLEPLCQLLARHKSNLVWLNLQFAASAVNSTLKWLQTLVALAFVAVYVRYASAVQIMSRTDLAYSQPSQDRAK